MTNIVKPTNYFDAYIGNIIMLSEKNDYSHIVMSDKRLDISRYLGEMANGAFSWVEIADNASVLVVDSLWGAYLNNVASRCSKLTVLEVDPFIASCTSHRMRGYKNVNIISGNVSSIAKNEQYDIIFFTPYDKRSAFFQKDEYICLWNELKTHLNAYGRMYSAVPNRIGVKYLCGEPDEINGYPFVGITESGSTHYRFDCKELIDTIKSVGFESIKLYYPYPDLLTPQLIYTDEYQPSSEICERLKIYANQPLNRFLSEKKLTDILARNNVLDAFSNYIIAECSNNTLSNSVYVAVSSERSHDRAFATVIYSDNIVKKIPVYPEGAKGLEKLCRNYCEQCKHGIPSLEIKLESGAALMKKVDAPSLSEHLREAASNGNRNEILRCTDMLYKYICSSSDISFNDEGCIILKKAFIEMIPVNCFYTENDLLFYDQEYTMDNCPAGYVMFRAINDIYKFIPQVERIVTIVEMKQRYDLDVKWNDFLKMESDFCQKLVNADTYTYRNEWLSENDDILQRNRKALKMATNKSIRIFDPLYELNEKKIILFGSGKYADYYCEKFGTKYSPLFYIDNNPEKWNTEKKGIPIKSPDALNSLIQGTFRVIITVADYKPIESQLQEAGISDYRIFNRKVADLLNLSIEDTVSEDKYNIGYVTGAFDLFHIGHLNVLKNSKSRCHYLIVGVLTDEIIINEKHKTPFIPFEERIEIVKQCKYVDRVIAIDKHNTNKLDAWKELKYGCLFSGSDHANDKGWLTLQSQLRSLGSELEFFPYTQSTNSTILQNIIHNELSK